MKKMKKILVAVLTIAMIAALGGCSSKGSSTSETGETTSEVTTAPADTATPEATESADQTDTAQSGSLEGTITITGSTSVEKILTAMIDEFTALNPDVTINYTGTGSSAGIADAISGANDIGASSRDLKEDETGLQSETFAYDGIAIAVNPANTITDITTEDLAKIFSGQITNWSELGGNDADIIVVSREGASGTRDAFEELIGLEDAGGLVEDTTVVEGNGNVQTTVAGNENAIGYISFSYIDQTVKALNVNEVEPTAENAKAGSYPLSRPFLFVYTQEKATPLVQAFLDYALSEDGQGFVEEHGGIRIDK